MKKRGGRIFFGGLPVATVCTMITLATVSVIVTSLCTVVVTIMMLTRTGTKQRSDNRTTNLSRLIMIGNLRIER